MNFLAKSLLVVAALGLAACNNPDRYGAGGAGGAGSVGGAGGTGIDTTGLGDPNNPASVAYFNRSIGDRVLFAVDQSTLSPEARTVLAGQAQWLIANPGYAAIIEGHADEQGTRDYNLGLSRKRAVAAMNYLITQGVAQSRMTTIPYGKERPLEVCSEEACYAKNRRAVTVLSVGAGV